MEQGCGAYRSLIECRYKLIGHAEVFLFGDSREGFLKNDILYRKNFVLAFK